MKKWVFGVLALFAAVAVGIPFLSGVVMEKMVDRSASQFNLECARVGSDMALEILNYDRRVWESTVEWRLDLGELAKLYGRDEIVFSDQARHGYKGVVSQTRLDKNDGYADFIARYHGGQDPLTIITRYPLRGDIVSTMTLDALDVQNEDLTLSIKPGHFVFTVDKMLRSFKGELTWEGARIPDKIKVGKIDFRSEMDKISTFIWDGYTRFKLERLDVNEQAQGVTIKAVNIENRWDFNQTEDRLSITGQVEAESVARNRSVLMSDLFVRFGLNRMDADGYEDFARHYAAMIREMITSMAQHNYDPEKVGMIITKGMAGQGLQVLAEAEKLLKKDMEIELSGLRAQFPAGRLWGDFSVELKRDITLTGLIPVMLQPGLILDMVSLSSQFSFPEALVKDPALFLNPVYPGMQTGLFVLEGTLLTHQAHTADGKLWVNQIEVPL